MKRLLALLILVMFLGTNMSVLADPVFEGHAEKSDKVRQELESELFTGKVEQMERSDVIHMTVSQVLDSNINIEGDEFLQKS